MMRETVDIAEQRDRGGRFVNGGKPGPGRPKGARSKLGEAFLEDLRDAWNEHGATALARCAQEEPGQFVRVVASLMPKDINLNVAVDATTFADRFRTALELLGIEPAPPRPHHPLPGQPRMIEHKHVGSR
jgi:hypothetical protein